MSNDAVLSSLLSLPQDESARAGCALCARPTEVEAGSRSHSAHTHTGVEAFYVLEGQATVEVEDELYTLGPNEALALDASRPHGIFNGSSARVRYMVIVSQ